MQAYQKLPICDETHRAENVFKLKSGKLIDRNYSPFDTNLKLFYTGFWRTKKICIKIL